MVLFLWRTQTEATTRFPLRASRRNQPCWHLDFVLLNSRTGREWISVVLSHSLVVIYHGSPRILSIHRDLKNEILYCVGCTVVSLFLLVKAFKSSFQCHLIFFCNAILSFIILPFMDVHCFICWSLITGFGLPGFLQFFVVKYTVMVYVLIARHLSLIFIKVSLR